ncbi:MAG: CHASE2 domain-containing protein [Sulfuricaulis sp.]|uniref:CHASE2 domain-containing protein n=1 Tax=Sulfuricaulis sp. TaxID=2003553 RepID=UPI0025E0FC92|nr:CHASE2 domain-containing protein [Sulfuricaulis sp.]MCR4348132.1 CHASE2 domain-containing protein [Sulfuricaulis sp.]
MQAHNPLQGFARFFLLPLSSLSDRLGNWFYVGLAVVVSAVAVFAIATGSTAGMKNKAYDLIMKSRFQHPAADTDIVIVDIDEPALAAMAPEYGRWPWPRNIMGELVEGIAAQQPKAIVFDIAFSDPDVFNIEGDRYFRGVIAAAPNTFFPMIRLNEENDSLSELRVMQLPGASKLDPAAPDSATMAVILPFFFDALTDHRLGTNNIYTGEDGMVRTYDVYADEYGWRVGSLPANVAAALGVPLPDQTDILLNWRGKPPSYRRVSFHEIYFDLLKSKKTRPVDEFAGKIVIIGSTAPSLFDLKTTPMAKAHPGVEILASAIDNLKKGDYLTELPPWIYILVTLISVVLLTIAFVYNIDHRIVNLTFTVLQSGFLAVSYLTLNFSTIFVDLTAPFAFSLAYFTVARFNYMFAGFRRSGQPFFSTALDEGNACRVVLAQCHIHLNNRRARLGLGASLKKQVGLSRYGLVTSPFFKGMPLLHAFFHDTMVFYWLVSADQSAEVLQDVISVMERSMPAIRKSARRASKDGPVVTWLLHGFAFTVDAEGTWRLKGEEGMAKLFALASKTGKAGGGEVIRVIATKEFIESCRGTEGLKVSEELEKAGLKLQRA